MQRRVVKYILHSNIGRYLEWDFHYVKQQVHEFPPHGGRIEFERCRLDCLQYVANPLFHLAFLLRLWNRQDKNEENKNTGFDRIKMNTTTRTIANGSVDIEPSEPH